MFKEIFTKQTGGWVEFSDWLLQELERRGWSNSELARRANIVPSTVSMVISGKQKPGVDFCRGVARALNMPPERIFRLAGLLPRRETKDELIEDFIFYWEQLPEHEQRRLINMAWLMQVERARNEAGENTRPDSSPPMLPGLANAET